MNTLLNRWLGKHAAILFNAGSLLGTRVVTSGLGFVYWWVAAKLFAPEAVGLASTAVSAMMLLGMIGVLGMGTLLIGELPRRPGEAGSLIVTALLVSGTASMLFGIGFAVVAPYLSAELEPLSSNVWRAALFASGVMLTTITMIIDQALIGVLRGQIQLWRNIIFSALKLGVLAAVGLWLADHLGMMIYATWALGNLVSIIYVAASGWAANAAISGYRPQWQFMNDLRGPAIKHYALNLSLQVPGFTLPLIVTVLLSTESNASFYAAWMLASFLHTMPHALTTVLYAVGAADRALLAEKMRFTLGVSLALGTAGALVLIGGAYPILGFFGEIYAHQAAPSLRLLALSIFPIIIKAHFVAVCQIRGRMLHAARLMAFGGIIELTLATLGAQIGGQSGLSAGWALAIAMEAAMALPLVYQAATTADPPLIAEAPIHAR